MRKRISGPFGAGLTARRARLLGAAIVAKKINRMSRELSLLSRRVRDL